MIVDAHAHIFDAIKGRIGSGQIKPLSNGGLRLGDGKVVQLLPHASGELQFTAEMLLNFMDESGVDRAILLQGPFYGDMNDYVLHAMQRWPDRFVGAAYLDLWAENPRENFHRVIDQMGFRIVKFELSESTGLAGLHPELRLDDPHLEWFWESVHRKQIVVVLDLGHVGGKAYQTQSIDRIARMYPGLRIVIAHLAQPPINQPNNNTLQQLWQEQILLARHPTVWLDLASLPNYAIAAGENDPYPGAIESIRRAVALVGPEKLLWGSDIPGVLVNSTYPQLKDYLNACDFLSWSDRDGIFGNNAARAFSLGKIHDSKLV